MNSTYIQIDDMRVYGSRSALIRFLSDCGV